MIDDNPKIKQSQIFHYLLTNKQNICQKYHLKKIGVFGSYARSEQTPESDLDLLVEFEDNTPELTEKKEYLRKEIQSVFHINVDICREKYIKPIFRQQILSDVIYV
jgi:predicted nucleotidyltransferase